MLIANQIVEVKWNASNKKHFESKGYAFTRKGEKFLVNADDLAKHSKIKVKVKCDYCGDVTEKSFGGYIVQNNKNELHGIFKDACGKCRGAKSSEIYGTQLISENEILEEVSPAQSSYSEHFLIEEFYRYKKEFGAYPRKIDIEGNTNYPSATSYYNKWGNWRNFLNYLDLIGESGIYKEDEEVIKNMYPVHSFTMSDINNKLIEKRSIYEINKIIAKLGFEPRNLYVKREYNLSLPNKLVFEKALKDLELDIGKCPTSTDFDAYTKLNKLPSRRLVEKELCKTYSQLCHEILNETNNVNLKTKEDLAKDLLMLADKLGRTPKANELVRHGLSTRKFYVKTFNMDFLDILKSLNLAPALGNDRMYLSNEEMLNSFSKLNDELGHLPSWYDLDNCDYTPNHKTYVYQFKSLKNVYKILRLEDESINQEISGGFVSRNIKGELCRSIPELKISNLLIKNGIDYEDNYKYSKLNRDLKIRWTMDWYLVDFDICVEYFGMYEVNQLNKKTRVGKYSRKAKRKIQHCKDNDIKLIELYVDDLKCGLNGVIEKFARYGIDLQEETAKIAVQQ